VVSPALPFPTRSIHLPVAFAGGSEDFAANDFFSLLHPAKGILQRASQVIPHAF